MRTLGILLLGFSIASSAFAQASSATQTIHISVQTPTRMVAQKSMLAMDIRSEAHGLVGRIEDRMSIRSRIGRKITASLKESMPRGSKLLVRLDVEARRPTERVELTEAVRSVDVASGLSDRSEVSAPVEYAVMADAGSPSLAARTQTVVYTLTD